jgi:hypothetical protein
VFAVYGLGMCGFVNYGLYTKLLPGIAAAIRRKRWWNASWRTELALDNLVATPLLFFPAFYMCHAVVHRSVNPAEMATTWRTNVRITRYPLPLATPRLQFTLSCCVSWQ